MDKIKSMNGPQFEASWHNLIPLINIMSMIINLARSLHSMAILKFNEQQLNSQHVPSFQHF